MLVLTSLLAGYNTFLCDMDIQFIHNPFLYLPLQHYWEMQLEPIEWCTGFYYNKMNDWTITMQMEVLAGISANPLIDDQEVYNKWIAYHRLITPEILNSQLFPLDYELFPIGKQYGSPTAVIQHNNWLFGANDKRQRQIKWGLLLYNQTKTEQKKAEYQELLKKQSDSNSTSPPPPRLNYPSHPSLLVCEYCVACESMKPKLPPLRATWPGPLIITNFTGYRGPDTNHF